MKVIKSPRFMIPHLGHRRKEASCCHHNMFALHLVPYVMYVSYFWQIHQCPYVYDVLINYDVEQIV